jgi:hypothetical protein
MPLKARAGGEENHAVAMETAKGVQLGNGKRRCGGRGCGNNTPPVRRAAGLTRHPCTLTGPWAM